MDINSKNFENIESDFPLANYGRDGNIDVLIFISAWTSSEINEKDYLSLTKRDKLEHMNSTLNYWLFRLIPMLNGVFLGKSFTHIPRMQKE